MIQIWKASNRRNIFKSRKSHLRMYFDDVSRYSLPWEPSDGSGGDEYDFNISLEKLREIEIRAAQDKVEAIKRMLGGYDWESAIKLSNNKGTKKIVLNSFSSFIIADPLPLYFRLSMK